MRVTHFYQPKQNNWNDSRRSIFLSVFGGWYLSISEQQAKAARTECARYHPDTGKFEWLGEE